MRLPKACTSSSPAREGELVSTPARTRGAVRPRAPFPRRVGYRTHAVARTRMARYRSRGAGLRPPLVHEGAVEVPEDRSAPAGGAATDDRVASDRTSATRMGEGPPLVLVDGAFCYRGMGPSSPLAALLAESYTVFTYDRRGRGESGDRRPYAVERELEDLEALITDGPGALRSGAIAWCRLAVARRTVAGIQSRATGMSRVAAGSWPPPGAVMSRLSRASP